MRPLTPCPRAVPLAPLAPLAILALLTGGCTGKAPDSAGCVEAGSGSLVVDVDGFDGVWGTAPAVDVHDGSGALLGTFQEGGTTTLPGGLYTVSVRRGIAAPDGFAGSSSGLLQGTVSQVCVPDGGSATVAVIAEPQPSSSRLWGISGETLAGYAGISDPGDEVQADAVLSFPNTNDLRGAAWDLWGNLWAVASPTYGARFLVVEPGKVAGKGEATVLHEVTSAALDSAEVHDLDLDAAGNLWVTIRSRGDGFAGVLVYGVDDVRESFLGLTELEPVWSGPVSDAVAPERLYFDAEGGFYFADPGTDTVFHVPDAAYVLTTPGLDTATELVPDRSFLTTVDDGTGERGLGGPTDMVLDDTGLWVLYRTAAIVAHVSRSAEGTVQSNFTYTMDASALPAGLQRDGGNGIWLASDLQSDAGGLERFDAGDGTIDLDTTMPDLASPVHLMFDPPVPIPE